MDNDDDSENKNGEILSKKSYENDGKEKMKIEEEIKEEIKEEKIEFKKPATKKDKHI